MGQSCCGGMKPGQHHKSLPEEKKPNNIDEKEKLSNGPQAGDDEAVAKETPVTGDQQQKPDNEAPANHTGDHAPAVTEEVELKITEPDRTEPAPQVCPVAEKPDVCPKLEAGQEPDAATDKKDTRTDDENPSTSEVLFVSEEGDILPSDPGTRVVKTTTTTVTKHSTRTKVTEVRTSVFDDETGETPAEPVSTTAEQPQEEQQEHGKIDDLQGQEPVKAADDVTETQLVASSTVVEQEAPASSMSSAVTEEVVCTPVEMTEVPVEEMVVAASVTEDQQSTPPPPPAADSEPEQIPVEHQAAADDSARAGEEIVSSVDVTPPMPAEQILEEPASVPETVASEVPVEEPSETVCSEPVTEVAVEHDKASEDQPVEPSPQEHDVPSDDLEAKTLPPEETAPTHDEEIPSVDEAPVSSEAPEELPVVEESHAAVTDEATVETQPQTSSDDLEETAPTHREEIPTADDTPVANEAPEELSPVAVAAETPEQPQMSPEELPKDNETTEVQSDIVPDLPASDDLASPDAEVIDHSQVADAESKPEDGVNLSSVHDDAPEIQPEELPPPSPPAVDEVPSAGSEEHPELPELESYVKPAIDTGYEQPEHNAINGAVDSADEQAATSTAEAVDNGGEVPVASDA